MTEEMIKDLIAHLLDEDYSPDEVFNFLVSEDFERIDELSRKTLQSYLDKLHDKNKPLGNRKNGHGAMTFGASLAAKTRLNNGHFWDKNTGKYKKYNKESVEQINELSKKTLRSYITKASTSRSIAHHGHDSAAVHRDYDKMKKVDKTLIKRNKGISNTKHRLDHNRFASSNNLKPYYKEDVDLNEGKLKELDIKVKEKSATPEEKRKYQKLKQNRLGKPAKSVKEELSPKASASTYIHDFVHSKNKTFAGKSKKERINMALGAYYSKKRLKEGIDETGNSEDNIDNRRRNADESRRGNPEMQTEAIKMKLTPGKRMKPKEFARRKAEVMAAQKVAAQKKAEPKPPPKEETIETDDNNRNSRILKGHFPWGKVSTVAAKTAVAKLKGIQKPADRLHAIDSIWNSKHHFDHLMKHGNVPAKKPEKTGPRSKITLPKITGI